jgi:putative ABC transport system substrate-binding protein
MRKTVRAGAVALCLASGMIAADAGAREAPRVGVFSIAGTPGTEDAFAGIRDGFRLAGLEPVLLERSAEDDDGAARSVLAEFAFEKVDVVFALGGPAAGRARDALRDRPVVFAAVAEPEARGLPGRGNVCGTAGGVPARGLIDACRRAVPDLRSLLVLAPEGDVEAAATARDLASNAADHDLEVATRAWPVAIETLASAPPDAIWLPPSLPQEDAEQLARALEGKRILLIGSSRPHLDAGCAVVVRTDGRRLGALAVVLATRVLRGEAPSRVGVLRPARRIVEVNLTAARRLGVELPLTLLAGADHIVPGYGARR